MLSPQDIQVITMNRTIFIVLVEATRLLRIRRSKASTRLLARLPAHVPRSRWIESEREEALLGKEAGKDGGEVAHQDQAFLSFGAGPRICPGVVRRSNKQGSI